MFLDWGNNWNKRKRLVLPGSYSYTNNPPRPAAAPFASRFLLPLHQTEARRGESSGCSAGTPEARRCLLSKQSFSQRSLLSVVTPCPLAGIFWQCVAEPFPRGSSPRCQPLAGLQRGRGGGRVRRRALGGGGLAAGARGSPGHAAVLGKRREGGAVPAASLGRSVSALPDVFSF